MKQEGFYKVKVRDMGPSFITIGLLIRYNEKEIWTFAQGDGNSNGADYEVIEILGKIILPERVYE
jgi:hypothetical protein